MEPIVIVIREAKPGRFDADLVDGTPLVRGSLAPFLDACRRLLELGHAPEARAVMQRSATGEDCLRSTIGGAAKLRVRDGDGRGEPRFVKFDAYPGRSGHPVDKRTGG